MYPGPLRRTCALSPLHSTRARHHSVRGLGTGYRSATVLAGSGYAVHAAAPPLNNYTLGKRVSCTALIRGPTVPRTLQ